MRSIYLLISFIAATALFFYAFGNFTGQSNLLVNNDFINSAAINRNGPAAVSPTGTKNFSPPIFGGPSGQPAIIGPKGPPPNY